jgi:Family of unknown function (DUF5627)/Domain of unknown function (DUF1735)
MKKILYLLSIVTLLSGCENRDIDFPDYAFQAVYFPFQTPVRTLMLGDEEIGDNTIDLEHAFSIGVAIGGMYENTIDRVITIEYAPELARKIKDGSGNVLDSLPAQYYNATFDKIIIPAGSFFGKLRVNLTDAFFADTLATGLRYVIPLRITDAQGDSVLSGRPSISVASPDPRIASHWLVPPKNYVLFGVKYINPTHGVYLLRGKRVNVSNPLDVVTYSKRFIDDNDFTKLSTRSMTQNYMSTIGGTNKEGSGANAKYTMKLTFDKDNKSVTVSRKNAATVSVTGTGKFYSKADAEAESYNGKKHRTIYLDYNYIDGANTYHVNDSLVFVDTDMIFETFAVVVN